MSGSSWQHFATRNRLVGHWKLQIKFLPLQKQNTVTRFTLQVYPARIFRRQTMGPREQMTFLSPEIAPWALKRATFFHFFPNKVAQVE